MHIEITVYNVYNRKYGNYLLNNVVIHSGFSCSSATSENMGYNISQKYIRERILQRKMENYG